MNKIIKTAFFDALGILVYILLIVSFINFSQGVIPSGRVTLFVPIGMLLLFVFSAALTGWLFFGKPIVLYFDGKKKGALSLIAWTFVMLFVITLIIFGLLFLVAR